MLELGWIAEMDWTMYWFVFFLCLVYASVAMYSGITGAALMLPTMLIGFGFLGVPTLAMDEAIASSLFLETGAFVVGIYYYHQRGFIDLETVKFIGPYMIPAAVLGAIVSHRAPELALRFAYAMLMFVAAWFVVKRGAEQEEARHAECEEGRPRTIERTGDATLEFCAHGLPLQRLVTVVGAFLTGLISTGVGEVTAPGLIARSGFPVPVAAASSIVLVAITNLSAVLTHFVEIMMREGAGAIPWHVIVWGVPGKIIGAYIGTQFQGRFSESKSRWFFAGLYIFIGLTFIAYTLLGGG